MPDKKLTDSEIINALECCKNGTLNDCDGCPCFNDEDNSSTQECVENLMSNALDLINRLQEEKEALINGQETLQKYIANLQAENENYSKNNRQMTSDILKLYKGLEQAKAEIERLKPFEDKIAEFNSHIRVEDMLVFASSLEEWLEFCDNLKAEAYAERLKEWFRKESEVYKLIDNLLKELVGEDK